MSENKRKSKKMECVRHFNYFDNKTGCVYCRRFHEVVLFNEKHWRHCNKCYLFCGCLQGQGVECMWKEDISKNGIDTTWWYAEDPYEEYKRVDLLIKHKVIKKRYDVNEIIKDFGLQKIDDKDNK